MGCCPSLWGRQDRSPWQWEPAGDAACTQGTNQEESAGVGAGDHCPPGEHPSDPLPPARPPPPKGSANSTLSWKLKHVSPWGHLTNHKKYLTCSDFISMRTGICSLFFMDLPNDQLSYHFKKPVKLVWTGLRTNVRIVSEDKPSC